MPRSLSPPGALEGTAGTSGLVARVELGHVLVRQAEIEDAQVLLDALPVGGLGDGRKPVLEAPAQHDLCGGAPDALRNTFDRRVGEVPAGPQRAVRLAGDVALPSDLAQ